MNSVLKSNLILTTFFIFMALVLFFPALATADFQVAYTSAVEEKPAVAYNSNTGKFLVAYLIHTGDHDELRCQLHNADGSKSGGVINPLPSVEALGRPALAYNPNTNRFFVAVPVHIGGGIQPATVVIGQFLNGDGTTIPLLIYRKLFSNYFYSSYYPNYYIDDYNALHVVCNTILNEFMVTVQRTVTINWVTPWVSLNVIDAQRVAYSGGYTSDVFRLADFGSKSINGHAISHAPIAGTTPAGGRYLFATVYPYPFPISKYEIKTTLLDSEGNVIKDDIPLYMGNPEGYYNVGDIAYGEVEGKKRFLLVYSDRNNYQPGYPSQEWSGVWGTYVDPTKTSYGTTPRNTPFPISLVNTHFLSNETDPTPRVSYNPNTKAFYVVWREVPTLDFQYDEEHRSHIRGNVVDYFVEDGLYDTQDVPLPAADSNVIISDITGTCTTVGQACYSNEDPKFPDVSGSYGDSAVVVWHQKFSSSDLNVKGDFLTYSGECGFTDVPPSHWAEEAICKIYDAGITTGCSQNPLKYCPEDTVTRSQMAVFLGRGIHGSSFTPPTATGIFSDVPVSYWAADWIEQFSSDGITSGCGTNPLRYCPGDNVTRAQMAIFLLRSKHGKNYTPPVASGIFSDVPVTYWAASWIEQLYNEGITTGCGTGPLRYCPDSSVTRAQMAVFIMRTFGL